MRRIVVLVAALAGCGRFGFGATATTDAAGDAGDDAAADALDAPPEPDTWRVTTPLPTKREMPCAVVLDGRIYAFGGVDGTDGELDEAIVADIQPDGTLGTWRQTSPLPYRIWWHACAVDAATRTVYVLGGDLGNMPQATVARASVAANGDLGPWVAEVALPGPRRGLGAIAAGGMLYALGGESASGFTLNATVFQIPISSSGALVGPWTTAMALPGPDYMFGTALLDGRVYTTGGYAGGAQVRSALIGGGFQGETALPAARQRHGSVVVGRYLYAMGGEHTFQGANLDTVLRAPIGATGAVGAWQAMPALPMPRAYLGFATDGKRIYVLGGSDDVSAVATVWVLTPPP